MRFISSLIVFFASTSSFLSQANQPLVLENFENISSIDIGSEELFLKGPSPENWEKPNTVGGIKDYVVVKDATNQFLRAKFIAGTKGKVIFKKVDWNIQAQPFLSWQWRVQSWATGSTVKEARKEDSTASVYVSFKSGMKNYVIKYIWAHTDAVDSGYSKGKWNPAGALEAIVIRSGGDTNTWVTEKRNVIEDFKKLYKKEIPSSTASGIWVLT